MGHEMRVGPMRSELQGALREPEGGQSRQRPSPNAAMGVSEPYACGMPPDGAAGRTGPAGKAAGALAALALALCAFSGVGLSACAADSAHQSGEGASAVSDSQQGASAVVGRLPSRTWAASESASLPTAESLAQGISSRGLAPTDDWDASSGELPGAGLSLASEEGSQTPVPHVHYTWDDPNGVRWKVFANDGRFYAAPASRDGVPLGVDCILSEDGGVVQYAPGQDEFMEFEGGTMEGGVDIVKVDSIDAASLAAWAQQNLPVDGEGSPDALSGPYAADSGSLFEEGGAI